MADRKTSPGNLPNRDPPVRNGAATCDAARFPPRHTDPLRHPPRRQSSNPLLWLWLGSGVAILAVVLGLIYFYARGGASVRRPMRVDNRSSGLTESAEIANSAGAEGVGVEPDPAANSAVASTEEAYVGATPAEQREPDDGRQKPGVALRDPFAKLPDAVELPVPMGGPTALIDRQREAMVIGELVDAADAEVKLTLADGAASLGEGLGLRIATGRNPESKWDVRLVEKLPAADHQSLIRRVPEDPVATIFVESSSLKFAWEAASDHPQAEQLRNCMLQLTSGRYSHELRLRPVQQVKAFLFDVENSTYDAVMDGRALPATERLYLELSAHRGFAGQWNVTPPDQRVGSSETLSVSSEGTPHIEVVAELRELHDSPTVRIRCYYYQDDRRRVFGKESFEEQLTRTQASLLRSRRSLSSFQSELPVVQSKLGEARAWVPRNGQESTQRAGMINNLARQLIRGESAIARLSDSIPKNEAAVAELQAIARIANQIHRNATIEFEVGVVGDDGDFPLLVATRAP